MDHTTTSLSSSKPSTLQPLGASTHDADNEGNEALRTLLTSPVTSSAAHVASNNKNDRANKAKEQSPPGGGGTGESRGTTGHVRMLREELRESIQEEERVMSKMMELAQVRGRLKVQVHQREAEVELADMVRRRDELQGTRQAFQL